MINAKQKKQLKKLAHSIKPLVIIGNGELSEELIKNTNNALFNHELIKIKALSCVTTHIKEIAETLSKETEADVVNVIGHTVILYKHSSKDSIENIVLESA